jgi:DNA-binding Xre family transcriptional regulator
MPVIWNLKKWLVLEQNIYRPVDLQKLIEEKAGVKLSLQAVSSLINNEPSGVRFKTIQALCNALDCKLSDFCDVIPDSSKEGKKGLKQGNQPQPLYGNPKQSTDEEDSIFPDPNQYGQSNDKREIS